MSNIPHRVKFHSQPMADAYVAMGWQLTSEFRATGNDEPYEIVLVWPGPGEPVRPEGTWYGESEGVEPGAAADTNAGNSN